MGSGTNGNLRNSWCPGKSRSCGVVSESRTRVGCDPTAAKGTNSLLWRQYKRSKPWEENASAYNQVLIGLSWGAPGRVWEAPGGNPEVWQQPVTTILSQHGIYLCGTHSLVVGGHFKEQETDLEASPKSAFIKRRVLDPNPDLPRTKPIFLERLGRGAQETVQARRCWGGRKSPERLGGRSTCRLLEPQKPPWGSWAC